MNPLDVNCPRFALSAAISHDLAPTLPPPQSDHGQGTHGTAAPPSQCPRHANRRPAKLLSLIHERWFFYLRTRHTLLLARRAWTLSLLLLTAAVRESLPRSSSNSRSATTALAHSSETRSSPTSVSTTTWMRPPPAGIAHSTTGSPSHPRSPVPSSRRSPPPASSSASQISSW